MIDLFSIAVTHGLLALAAWRLVLRADLDADPATADPAAEEAPRPQRRMRGPRD
jgi:hypothetical protein